MRERDWAHRFLIIAAATLLGGLLAYLIIGNASPFLFVQMLLLVAILPFILTDTTKALYALILVRPLADAFSAHSFNLFDRLTINFASLLSIVVLVWGGIVLLARRRKEQKLPFVVPIFLFVLASVPGIITTPNPNITITEFLRFSSIFLLFFVAVTQITTERKFTGLLAAIAVSLIGPSVVAAYQLVTKSGLTFGDVANRVYGTFGHPNAFAFYLVLCLALFLGVFFSRKKKDIPWFSVAGILLLIVLLLLTSTRGAWLGFAIVVAVFGWIRFRTALLIGVLVCGALYVFAPTINRFTVSAFDIDLNRTPIISRIIAPQSDDSSVAFRFQLWSEMRPKFSEQPVIGHGLGTFSLIREQQVFDFFQGTEAHNDYLRLAIETGALGLGTYLILLFLTAKKLLLVYRSVITMRYRWIVLGMLGFFAAFLVMSFFDNLLQGTAVMWAMWVLLGAVFNLPKIAREEN